MTAPPGARRNGAPSRAGWFDRGVASPLPASDDELRAEAARLLPSFSWVLPRRLAGMAYPYRGTGPLLRRAGVVAVLSLTEEAPEDDLVEAGLRVRREPIADFGAPSEGVLARCVDFVTQRWREEQAVVVHCLAGRGRTGTVLAACLVADGLGADEAIATVRRLRPGSIETRAQEASVRAFAAGRGGRT